MLVECRLPFRIDNEPFHFEFLESLDHVRPSAAHMRIRDRKARKAIGDNTRARIERAVAARKHHRDGDDARQEAAEIGNDEIETGAEQQQRAIAYLTVGEPCRHFAGTTGKFREG
jgi:hypothetical protein